MSEQSGAPAGSDAAPAIDTTSELSISEAAAMLEQYAEPPEKEQAADGADDATADPELSKDNSDPEKDPAEDAEDAEPEDKLPPIERPRSWTKDEDAEWQSLPRTMQQKIVAREQERDTGLRRSQNEAAEARKAIEAERQEVLKARQEAAAEASRAREILLREQQGTFADIKTTADVRVLAEQDPFRYLQWKAHQDDLQWAAFATQKAEQEKAQEKQGKRAEYEKAQNKQLLELLPEMADPKKASELRERAVSKLTGDYGLTNDQLSRWLQDDIGHEILSNAGIQKLIADSLKLEEIQSAPKAVSAKPLPPVVRPGVARNAGAADSERIQALEKKLTETGDMKVAAQILELRNAQRGRRAS